MRILITGADGFVGTHLCALLRVSGHTVHAASGPGRGPDVLDILDAAAVRSRLRETSPEAIIHLAGLSSVGQSHATPGRSFEVNVVGTVHLLDAVRHEAPRARVLLVSSGEVYGRTAGDTPASESTLLSPGSPYAASKAAMEIAGLQFHRAYQLDIMIARPMNHLGKGQDARFVVPAFARQIAAMQAGGGPNKIAVGDLSPVRDFSHVEDVVEAYHLLLQKGTAGEVYNVASGVGRSIRALLDELLSLAGVAASIEVDPARVRPTELPALVGDASKLRALGWHPRRTVREALADVLAEAGAAILSAPAT